MSNLKSLIENSDDSDLISYIESYPYKSRLADDLFYHATKALEKGETRLFHIIHKTLPEFFRSGNRLRIVISFDNVEVIKLYLQEGCQDNALTYLNIAAINGSSILAYLIETGLDMEAPDPNIKPLKTPLETAISNCNIPGVKVLLGCGADIKNCSFGHLGLDTGIRFDPRVKSLIRILLESGIDPNPRIGFLLEIMGSLDFETIELLIEYGCNPRDHNDYALFNALKNDREDVVNLLLKFGCSYSNIGSEVLDYGIRTSNQKLIFEMLGLGVKVYNNLFHLGIQIGNIDILRILKEHSEIDLTNHRFMETAIEYRRLKVSMYLFEENPLMDAGFITMQCVKEGFSEFLGWAIDWGMDSHHLCQMKSSFIRDRSFGIIKLWLKMGNSFSTEDLIYFVSQSKLYVLEYLMEDGFINSDDMSSEEITMIGISHSDPKMLKFLFKSNPMFPFDMCLYMHLTTNGSVSLSKPFISYVKPFVPDADVKAMCINEEYEGRIRKFESKYYGISSTRRRNFLEENSDLIGGRPLESIHILSVAVYEKLADPIKFLLENGCSMEMNEGLPLEICEKHKIDWKKLIN